MSDVVIRLDMSGLLSKWGFMDGDVLSESDWGKFGQLGGDEKNELLSELVERLCKENYGKRVETVRIGTNHNPIRAKVIDGEDVTKYWYCDPPKELVNLLGKISVTVDRVYDLMVEKMVNREVAR